jgi:glycosyltransferase involved in cell wall biosynthesis
MRVGIMSYPPLLQPESAVHVQVGETIDALNRRPGEAAPITAERVDPCRARLTDYDLIHVFAAVGGNHRIVETAVALAVPVVLTALISPGWNGANGSRARDSDRQMGELTGCDMRSSYAQIRGALEQASLVVALGLAEKEAIQGAFLIDGRKVTVVANGISPRFFDADGRLFREHTGIAGEFALSVGAVSPYNNQVGMALALFEVGLPFVVIGDARERDAGYLHQLRNLPGVTCLSSLRHADRMLASALAAATVFVLSSQGEVAPLAALEALACGTPVVMTSEYALELPGSDFALKTVGWDDRWAQQRALHSVLAQRPARAQVRALVHPFTWERAACELASAYTSLIGAAH